MPAIATTVYEALELKEPQRRALAREAVRLGIPLDDFITKLLEDKATEIDAAASAPTQRRRRAAEH